MAFFSEKDKAAFRSWIYWFAVLLQSGAIVLVAKPFLIFSRLDCPTWRDLGYGCGLFMAGIALALTATLMRIRLYERIDRDA